MDRYLFISHSSQDDAVVKQLRELLEVHGNLPWVDARELRGGTLLAREIEENIRVAEQVRVVGKGETQ